MTFTGQTATIFSQNIGGKLEGEKQFFNNSYLVSHFPHETIGSFMFFSFWFLKIFVCRERRKKTKRPNGCNIALWDLTNNHALFDFFQNWEIFNISKWIHVYYLYTRNAWQTAGNVMKLQEILKLSIWCLKLYYITHGSSFDTQSQKKTLQHLACSMLRLLF